MQNDPARRNNFITERLAMFILRDCGTGSGGFKAGNACAKGGEGGGGGTAEKDRQLASELLVPQSLGEQGLSQIAGLQTAQLLLLDRSGKASRIRDDDSLEETDMQISEGEIDQANYTYEINGALGERYNLDIEIGFSEGEDNLDDETERVADIVFSINGTIVENPDDKNLEGQGIKIMSAVEMSITHIMGVAPSVTEFMFQGNGVGRNGIARQKLYRRLANKIAAKKNGHVEEETYETDWKGAQHLTTTFGVYSGAARSLRSNDRKSIANFTYEYDPALVDPVSDKAQQKFWKLDENEDRDCGTGAGGFKAGNECAKGGDGESDGAGDGEPKGKSETDYDKLEKELQVPASLLKEGILDVKGLQESIIHVDKQVISDDSEMSEVDDEISDGEVKELVYTYTVDGAQGKPINLGVKIGIQKDYDSQSGYKTDEDGNVIATAAISFTLNADYTESGDPNLVGQGAKILTLVENSITHFMKTCPNQTDFNFYGVGQGRNGLARQLLYRRLAKRVAAKTGGKFVERSQVYMDEGKEYTSSNWYISRTPSRLPRPIEAHSIRAIDENAVYHFTYTYETALVDPVSDKAAQKFWELDKNEDRDCGTGAGGFKAGNACAKGGEGGGEGGGGGKPKSKREPNYKKLEKELLLPASLLAEGLLEVDGLQDVKLFVYKPAGSGRTRLTTQTENKELNEQVKTGEVKGVEYRYVMEGAEENYNLDVAIEFENTYADDGQGAKIVDKDGNPVRTAAVNFMINKMFKEGDDPNLEGQGLKVTTLVEQSITHLIKSCPSQKEFNFQGVGVGRNGIARRLLYRRLANRIAAKVGGKVKETASNFTNSNGVLFISTDFQIVKSSTRSVRGASQELIAHFNYTYDPALVDPIADKAAQKFWELDKNEDRDCGTGAGGFKTGNECSKSTKKKNKPVDDTSNPPADK